MEKNGFGKKWGEKQILHENGSMFEWVREDEIIYPSWGYPKGS